MYHINASSGCTTRFRLRVTDPAICLSPSLPWEASHREVAVAEKAFKYACRPWELYARRLSASPGSYPGGAKIRFASFSKVTSSTRFGRHKGHKVSSAGPLQANEVDRNRTYWPATLPTSWVRWPCPRTLSTYRLPVCASASSKLAPCSRSLSFVQSTNRHGSGVVKPVASELSACLRPIGSAPVPD